MNKITFELPIYTFQIDFNNHVSNIVYSQWMEIGRTKLLEAIAMPVHKVAEEGFVPVLIGSMKILGQELLGATKAKMIEVRRTTGYLAKDSTPALAAH